MNRFLLVSTIALLASCSNHRAILVPGAPSDSRYIIMLDHGSPEGVANRFNLTPLHTFKNFGSGFVARIPSNAVEVVRRDPRVKLIRPDLEGAVTQADEGTIGSPITARSSRSQPRPLQVIPTGVQRIGRLQLSNPAVPDVDGHPDTGSALNVAVLDTGVDYQHPDLHVAGGINLCSTQLCTIGTNTSLCGGGLTPLTQQDNQECWNDADDPSSPTTPGHGTGVAGVISALDNGIGVVGVAANANLYVVRVANARQGVAFSDAIAGLQWVLDTHADSDTSNDINVVNMSFTFGPLAGTDQPCGPNCACGTDILHEKVCRARALGIVVVAAAGNANLNLDVHKVYPAVYDDVITVSSLTDSDGEPGGEDCNRLPCPDFCYADTCAVTACNGTCTPTGCPTFCATAKEDDSFTFGFSNYGSDIDLMAPGVRIYTTVRMQAGRYGFGTGTSFAAPHVAGAALLYMMIHGAPTDDVGVDLLQAALVSAGDSAPCDRASTPTTTESCSTDPDGLFEPLVRVSTL